MKDLIVIGAGPAGMTAALYALRAGKSVLLIECEAFGGQITQSRRVENYPGIADISGMDLADRMVSQVMSLGAEIEVGRVLEIRTEGTAKTVVSENGEFTARAVILATGVRHRKLGVPGEEALIGKGISFCAICDGAFFRDREVAVLGGGNTAVQDALLLAETSSRVYLIHRRDGFRAEQTLMERVYANEKITVLTDTVVTEIRGEDTVDALLLKNVKTGETSVLAVAGLFEAIGSVPQNEAFANVIALDGDGYIDAGEDCRTTAEGIFAAGDCRRKEIRQLTTATADGSVAGLAAVEYLNTLG
jgi:thioredoxin reductase (NADPH)